MPTETDLKPLLDALLDDPPAEPHAVADVVRRAERARRRHRGLTTAAVAATVVAVAAVGTAIAETFPHGPDAAPQPAQPGAVGRVVHPDPQVQAVAGRDYTLDSRHVDPNLDRANDRLYPLVADDGTVVVSQPTERVPGNLLTEYNRYGLVAPGDSTITWLPAPPSAAYSDQFAPSGPQVADVVDGTVLWRDAANGDGGGPVRLAVYHLADRSWDEFTVPAVAPESSASQMPVRTDARLGGGRIWFTGAGRPSGSGEASRLWSVPEDGSGDPRDEGWVGDWDLDGDTLVFAEATNRPVSRVTVRDLSTGTTRSFDPLSGDRCNQLGLEAEHGRIALTEYCGTKNKIRDDRVHVIGLDGQQLVTVQGDGLSDAALGGDVVMVRAYVGRPGDPGGTYVYDFRTDRLARIGAGDAKFGSGVGAGGSTITWATAYNLRHGMTLWTATWR